jgi:hypothetical protein
MAKQAATPSPNLFLTFREVSTADGRPFAEALRWLNDQTGKATTNSRYGEYERGDVQPTTGSLNLILAAVLEAKLQAAGLKPEGIHEVIACCQLPEKPKAKPTRKKGVNSGKPKRRT